MKNLLWYCPRNCAQLIKETSFTVITQIINLTFTTNPNTELNKYLLCFLWIFLWVFSERHFSKQLPSHVILFFKSCTLLSGKQIPTKKTTNNKVWLRELIHYKKQEDRQFANLMYPIHTFQLLFVVVLVATVSHPQEVHYAAISPY